MSDEPIEPAIDIDESDVTEEQDEQGRPVGVIHRARIVGVTRVDPRRQHLTDPRHQTPQ